MSTVIAFSMRGDRDGLLRFVDNVLTTVGVTDFTVSVGPGTVLVGRFGGTTAEAMDVLNAAAELSAHHTEEVSAALTVGNLVPLHAPPWLEPNMEGAPAIVAARLVSRAEPRELILDAEVATDSATSGVRQGVPAKLEDIPGKHDGESFLAHRAKMFFPGARRSLVTKSNSPIKGGSPDAQLSDATKQDLARLHAACMDTFVAPGLQHICGARDCAELSISSAWRLGSASGTG